jgi:hypothetical protein
MSSRSPRASRLPASAAPCSSPSRSAGRTRRRAGWPTSACRRAGPGTGLSATARPSPRARATQDVISPSRSCRRPRSRSGSRRRPRPGPRPPTTVRPARVHGAVHAHASHGVARGDRVRSSR